MLHSQVKKVNITLTNHTQTIIYWPYRRCYFFYIIQDRTSKMEDGLDPDKCIAFCIVFCSLTWMFGRTDCLGIIITCFLWRCEAALIDIINPLDVWYPYWPAIMSLQYHKSIGMCTLSSRCPTRTNWRSTMEPDGSQLRILGQRAVEIRVVCSVEYNRLHNFTI